MTSSIAFTQHDHKHCLRSVLTCIEALCSQRKVRLTPVRRRTLEILLESHHAVGAYDVLEKLKASGYGEKPPVVYRALHFLMEQGFVHKLEQQNAYVACTVPNTHHEPCFLTCQRCKRVVEQAVPNAHKQLLQTARQMGFVPDATVIELSGICKLCQKTK